MFARFCAFLHFMALRMPVPSPENAIRVIDTLAQRYPTLPLKVFTRKRPFVTLITTILTQRARDDTTLPVAQALFEAVDDTPMAFLSLGEENLARMIRRVGFARTKARNILNVCRTLLDEFKGDVPRELELLLKLPGVGRKTANIVLEHCFDIPTIAVDIHVHRITNRLGWVRTTRVEDTEQALMKLIPKSKWHLVNHVFVRHGQTLCKPIGPRCGECPVLLYCPFGQKRLGLK